MKDHATIRPAEPIDPALYAPSAQVHALIELRAGHRQTGTELNFVDEAERRGHDMATHGIGLAIRHLVELETGIDDPGELDLLCEQLATQPPRPVAGPAARVTNMGDKVLATVTLVDVADTQRRFFGGAEKAALITGRPHPAHDYRFHDGSATYPQEATATDIAQFLRAFGAITEPAAEPTSQAPPEGP